MHNVTTNRRKGNRLWRKLSYAGKCLPAYSWQRLTGGRSKNPVHLIMTLADHFEPSSIPGHDMGYAPPEVQDRRLEIWSNEYSRNFGRFRDHDGRPFVHTYFYPAEQYDSARVEKLAQLCRSGWGEIEIHLHHGIDAPDTAEHTRRQIVNFRDALVSNHASLSFLEGSRQARYAFGHGNCIESCSQALVRSCA